MFLTSVDDERPGWVVSAAGFLPALAGAVAVVWGDLADGRHLAVDVVGGALGLAKTHLGTVLTACAINLIRLDAWLTDTLRGTTRTSHFTDLELAA